MKEIIVKNGRFEFSEEATKAMKGIIGEALVEAVYLPYASEFHPSEDGGFAESVQATCIHFAGGNMVLLYLDLASFAMQSVTFTEVSDGA